METRNLVVLVVLALLVGAGAMFSLHRESLDPLQADRARRRSSQPLRPTLRHQCHPCNRSRRAKAQVT